MFRFWYEISFEKSFHNRDFQAFHYIHINVQTAFSILQYFMIGNEILHIFIKLLTYIEVNFNVTYESDEKNFENVCRKYFDQFS